MELPKLICRRLQLKSLDLVGGGSFSALASELLLWEAETEDSRVIQELRLPLHRCHSGQEHVELDKNCVTSVDITCMTDGVLRGL